MLSKEFITESKIERVQSWAGPMIPVIHNPSKAQFDQLVSKTRYIRGCISYNGNDLWIWNAYNAVHPNIIQELGLEHVDCIYYHDGKWFGPVYDHDGLRPTLERLTPIPKKKWSDEDDELLNQLMTEDPKMVPDVKSHVELFWLQTKADLHWMLKHCVYPEFRALLLHDGRIVCWDGYYAIHNDVKRILRTVMPVSNSTVHLEIDDYGVGYWPGDPISRHAVENSTVLTNIYAPKPIPC